MSSLFASLGIARETLAAQQAGLDIAQNNIANVSTPGYTRQRPVFEPGEATAVTDYQSGEGVRLTGIQSFRDRLLDCRINQELQRQGEYESSSAALQQIETILDQNAGSGLETAISDFFNSFSSLANAPEDVSLRQEVLARADQLGTEFRRVYEQIQTVQESQDRSIGETVEEINSLSAQIADLNREVAAASASESGNELTLRDRRQQLLDRLGTLVDISYFEDENGNMSVITTRGALMVAGTESRQWETVRSTATGRLEVYLDGADITSSLQSGSLGGLLQVRDVKIAGYLKSLDDLAAAIISGVNEQHALGADLDGNPGGDFFVPFTEIVSGSTQGAARSMTLAIDDPDKIAAAGPSGGPGSNANATQLAALKDEFLLGGGTETVTQFYANLIFQVGLDAKTAGDDLETENSILLQLQNQRDSVCGVNLDEEALDVMRYQKVYQAAARYISIIDSLTEEVIQLLGD